MAHISNGIDNRLKQFLIFRTLTAFGNFPLSARHRLRRFTIVEDQAALRFTADTQPMPKSVSECAGGATFDVGEIWDRWSMSLARATI